MEMKQKEIPKDRQDEGTESFCANKLLYFHLERYIIPFLKNTLSKNSLYCLLCTYLCVSVRAWALLWACLCVYVYMQHFQLEQLLRTFFKKDFGCGPFGFKSLLNLLQYCFCFRFWFFWYQAMWVLSSETRDPAHTPCNGRQRLNHWTTREAPRDTFLNSQFPAPHSPCPFQFFFYCLGIFLKYTKYCFEEGISKDSQEIRSHWN